MKDQETKFVENLLRSYKSLKSERVNLNIKWNILERQKNNAIEGQQLSAAPYDRQPGAPRCSFKESPVLTIKNDMEYNSICNEQTFITERLKDIDDITTIIDSSLNSLSNQDKDIVYFYYVERYPLEKISQMVYLHKDRVWSHKTKALNYLYKSLNPLVGTVIFKAVS